MTVVGAIHVLFVSLTLFLGSPAANAKADQSWSAASDLTQLSLEDLLSVKVTLASRRSETLNQATAAIYVITQDDIRRSGLTCIPELLRLVPGMQVGHVDASKWALSSRGFNRRSASPQHAAAQLHRACRACPVPRHSGRAHLHPQASAVRGLRTPELRGSDCPISLARRQAPS